LLQFLQKNFRSDSFVKTIVAGFATKVVTFATDFSLININSCNIFEANMHGLQQKFYKKFRFQRWNYKGDNSLHYSLKYC